MEAMRAVGKDEPVTIAWRSFMKTESYDLAFKWVGNNEHLDGALWTAFVAGYKVAGGKIDG